MRNQAGVCGLAGLRRAATPGDRFRCIVGTPRIHAGIRGADVPIVTLSGAIATGVVHLNVLAEPCHAFGLLAGFPPRTDAVDVIETGIRDAAARDGFVRADPAVSKALLKAEIDGADVSVIALTIESAAIRLNCILTAVVDARIDRAGILICAV
jgi:hypothetical protein